MKNYWQRKETVERFAAKAPDKRMIKLLENADSKTTILDLGCAGGRNTVYLAKNDFDFYAIDSSEMMVAKTKERISEISGKREAQKRVLEMQMSNLLFDDDFFDWIIALGVIQDAQSEDEWQKTVSECTRVLKPKGKLLIAHFSPDSNPHGIGVKPVKGTKHLYTGFAKGRKLNLLSSKELDELLLEHKLLSIEKTYSVKVNTQAGYRTTVNGLYQLSS